MPPFKGELFEQAWTRGIALKISQGQTPRANSLPQGLEFTSVVGFALGKL